MTLGKGALKWQDVYIQIDEMNKVGPPQTDTSYKQTLSHVPYHAVCFLKKTLHLQPWRSEHLLQADA